MTKSKIRQILNILLTNNYYQINSQILYVNIMLFVELEDLTQLSGFFGVLAVAIA
ncbi:MAG: hypothetical protein V3V33_12685 [Candidatus Lokiarchaeia archaeon]